MFFPAGKSLEAFEWDYTGSVKRLLAQSSLYGNTLALDSVNFWKIIQLFNHRSCVRLESFKSSMNTVFNYLIGDVQPYDPSFFENT